jgi:hypothetical protein
MKRPNPGQSVARDRTEPIRPRPRWKMWAIGLETDHKWHLFRQVHGEWRHQRLMQGISKGRQAKLMTALADGGGFLAKAKALKLERSNYSRGDIDKLMGRIKPEFAKLRDAIREALNVQKSEADPLPFDPTNAGWRAEIEIGYAVQDDGDHVGGEKRLRFKTHEQLTDDELTDRRPSVR